MVGFFQTFLPAATLPITIFIDGGAFGAYHGSCADTGLHLAAFAGNNADLVRFLLVAELDECFMAAQSHWGCGNSSGEGLSRVLATDRYPAALDGFASAPTWLDGSRPSWVDNTEDTDRDYLSIGCAVLFLNYLRYQLHFPWAQIVAAGAPMLAATYTTLTGRADGWGRFTALVNYKYPEGMPSGVTGDNIFPIVELGEELGVLMREITTHWLVIADIVSRHGVFPVHPQPDDKRSLNALEDALGKLRSEASSIEVAAHKVANLLKTRTRDAT
jgi:hypothetical protein